MKNSKTKNILKYIIKILMSIFILFYIVIAPVTIFPKLKKSQGLVNKEIEIEYMGILELWNIDTFEGGSVSRTNFLQKRAMEFEKTHTGTFIMVQNMTPEQAVLNFENGNLPDMVSFGIGVGDKLVSNLIDLSGDYSVREILNGGKFNGKQLAVPYLLGGYTLINDNNSQFENNRISLPIGCGLSSYNNSLISLLINNMEVANLYENSSQLDTFSAYDKYLDKKFDCLLGTQRDMYRVLNRIEKGNMTPRSFYNFSGFTDLVQYIGVCAKDDVKQEISKQFVKHLLSDASQEKIENINMFSVTGKKLYSTGEFAEMESALSKPLKTLNVFLSNEKLEQLKQYSLNALAGDKQSLSELKKYLV